MTFAGGSLDDVLRGASSINVVEVIGAERIGPSSSGFYNYRLEISESFLGSPTNVLTSVPDRLSMDGLYLLVSQEGKLPLILPIVQLGPLPERDGLWLTMPSRAFESSSRFRRISLGEECAGRAPGTGTPLNLCPAGTEFVSWDDILALLRAGQISP